MESDDPEQDRDEPERTTSSPEEPPRMKLRDLSPEKDPMGATNERRATEINRSPDSEAG